MKRSYLVTTLILSLPLTSLAEPPKRQLSASAWYHQGVAAMKAGKPDEAKTAFENALKLKPGFSPAKYQLGRIPELRLKTKVAKRKALFKSTIIKEIDFQDATFKEALTALNKMALKASEEEFTPNFVVQDPKDQLEGETVTLKMQNIPVQAALTYILEAVGAEARFDEFATVIRPASK